NDEEEAHAAAAGRRAGPARDLGSEADRHAEVAVHLDLRRIRDPERARQHARGAAEERERARGVRRAQAAAARSRVERQPAVAAEPDLDPRMCVVIGDRPRARALVVGPAREADGDARRDAEVAEHQRHRAREVLAVAALRLHDEADERWRSRLRWMLVVLEAAARAEP